MHKITPRQAGAILAAAGSAAAAVAGPMMTGPAAAVASDTARTPSVTDVTNEKADLVAEARTRFEAAGIDVIDSAYRVLEVTSAEGSSYVVLPAGQELLIDDDGSVGLQIIPRSEFAPSRATAPTMQSRDAPSWKMSGSECAARFNYDGVYIDFCWRTGVLLNDTDSSKTWRTIEGFATAGPVTKPLKAADISLRTTESTASWADWDPKSDWTGSCQSTTYGISILGASISADATRCESWNITKPATPQTKFINRYDWNLGLPNGSVYDRELGATIAVHSPQSDEFSGWAYTTGLDGA